MKRTAILAAIFCAVFATSAFAEFSDEIIENTKSAVVAIYTDENLYYLRASGFFINSSGMILTNRHVIDGLNNIWGKSYKGEKIKLDIIYDGGYKDIALLVPNDLNKIFPYLNLCDGNKISAGTKVAAIGHGGSLWNVIRGEVKSEEYSYNANANEIIYSPAIIPGFSGGPTINESGCVLGINTAKEKFSDKFSYAIDLAELKSFLNEYRELTGRQQRIPVIGMILRDYKARAFFEFKKIRNKGVWVEKVISGSLADKIGIKKGDIIMKIGNRWINNVYDFREIIDNLPQSIAMPLDIKQVVFEVLCDLDKVNNTALAAVSKREVLLEDILREK